MVPTEQCLAKTGCFQCFERVSLSSPFSGISRIPRGLHKHRYYSHTPLQ